MPDVHAVVYYFGDLPVYMRLNLACEMPETYRIQGSKGLLEVTSQTLSFTPQLGIDDSPSYYTGSFPRAMRQEYETVARAGFILQLDCPDLAMGRHIQFAGLGLEEFRKMARLHLAALDHAVANIPPEQLRIHLCWGNYEGPHHYDVPLADILDLVFAARPQGISFEAANPRHAHEWRVFERVKLPPDKVIIPGVLDSTTNFIEHPELVAERIGRYARLVGRENVIAGTDCGFGTWVGQAAVDPDIVWAKLASLAEGARLASGELW